MLQYVPLMYQVCIFNQVRKRQQLAMAHSTQHTDCMFSESIARAVQEQHKKNVKEQYKCNIHSYKVPLREVPIHRGVSLARNEKHPTCAIIGTQTHGMKYLHTKVYNTWYTPY